jgi:phosphoglycolate phosphatase
VRPGRYVEHSANPPHPMRYHLVIFDFDGTLADSLGWVKGIYNQVAERFRLNPATPEELEALRNQDTKAILARLGVPLWKLPLVAVHVRTLAARAEPTISLFQGATGLLAELEARGVATAIVSSNSEENVRRVLGREAACRVRHYACGAGVFGKPSKFRSILKRAQVAPQDAIAIGDEVRDIEAAKSVGIDSGAVTWGYATAEVLRTRAPTSMFTTMGELRAALV